MKKIMTDASFQAPTQTAGLAARFIFDGQQIEVADYVTEVVDNHLAEFLAVEMALKFVVASGWQAESLWLHSDSKIVIQSLEKRYVKETLYAEVLARILVLSETMPLLFWKWLPEKENQAADQLARYALKHQTRTLVR